MQIQPELQLALLDASRMLGQTSSPWLIGGSCGLLLQNVHLENPPGDIDIYADAASLTKLHHAMANWSCDVPALSVTDRYRSILSHYKLPQGYTVELVGGFEVKEGISRYRVLVDFQLAPARVEVELVGRILPLMPLSHELLFNVLRNREDRYNAIALAMNANISAHMPLLEELLADNYFHSVHVQKIADLLHAPSLRKYAINCEEGIEGGGNCD